MTTTAAFRPASFVPYALASCAACAIGTAVAALSGRPALIGALAATLAAACAFAALTAVGRSGTNGLLAAFTAGFFARALLVAVGLFLSGARGDAALSYVFSFFAVYAATQVVEILFVRASSRQP